MRSFEWYVRPEAGECAQTAVTLPHAEAAVIAGTVEDEQGPVEGALVLLTDQETERLYQSKRLINALAVVGGAAGFLGVLSAYELLKQRFFLLLPQLYRVMTLSDSLPTFTM